MPLAPRTTTGAARVPRAAPTPRRDRFTFTVLGTADLHGHALDWDYVAGAPYAGPGSGDIGLARLSTLVDEVRADRGRARTLLIDAGDTLQGTALADYHARVEPITREGAAPHPMALAMNAVGYDAAALGNHDFDYGIPLLRAFERQCDFPLLAANALDARTGRPAFPPHWRTRLRTPSGPDVHVAVLGLTNPGTALWARSAVEGRLAFSGLPEEAARHVPRLRALGADVVIVAAHSGAGGPSSYGDRVPHAEHAAVRLARRVPGIDAVLVGHAHEEVGERRVRNAVTGRDVALSEPLYWGKRLSVFDFALVRENGGWRTDTVTARVLSSAGVPEDPRVTALAAPGHARAVAHTGQRIGGAARAMTAAEAPWRDTPLVRFIGHVRAETVRAALSGTRAAGVPVLAQVALPPRTAAIPAGRVTLGALAGLDPYGSTLEARLISGARLRDYLEHAARYFARTPPGAPVADPAALTNADGVPDYDYDVVGGVRYDIDIARPAGTRVTALAHAGRPVADDDAFVLAVTAHRAGGGGNYPHIAGAERLWSGQEPFRDTLASWVRAHGRIDPAAFAAAGGGWRLTRDGEPVLRGTAG
ncbi:bifunctional metallophosphatase/5'-nucleotidase [Streptomyces marincola]|uniref:bifunctional metallophosphatase/5'-nucleotidase n=1 Tax=Streptomyces marincola TaxID=2878388 RepID=UPI001CF45028|nr:bifunctional metallophosphatase/5'-nucleotidase [Streptomyces marincola]UCM90187.1 bifunctional metallophosphatase/5'-nucleotidase [Streptomyces marincola]